MKLLLIFAIAAIAYSYEHTDEVREDIFEDMALFQGDEGSLRMAVTALRQVAPAELRGHVDLISHHSELIQGQDNIGKAKAFAHNFAASKRAIMSAISALHGELTVGHRHDKAVLTKQRNLLNASIKKSLRDGKATANKYRFKACPTKRLEIESNNAKKKAKKQMHAHENQKVCPLGTRFKDMDINKGTPKLGTELRNKWNRARATYVRLQAVYNKAAAKHVAAVRKYNKAMSQFRTSVRLEAANAFNTCKNARDEYAALVKEVANNVNTRKQTYVATLVIKCYINNLTSNKSAKGCADKAKRANTSKWNIVAGPLIPCNSKATNAKIFGPPNWQPTSRNCTLRHWHEARHKEVTKKEQHKKERAKKERAQKERSKKAERRAKEKADKREKKAKELAKKEKAAKAKERKDKAARRERKAKADEKKSKELQQKERSTKERNNKAREREAKRVAQEKRNKKAAQQERQNKERGDKERGNKNRERSSKRARAPKAGFSHYLHRNSQNKNACATMRNFRNNLRSSGSYSKVTVASAGRGSYSCNTSAQATKICRAIKALTKVKVSCGGKTWSIGVCGAANGGQGMELNVGIANNGNSCQCVSGAHGFTLRPCIGHSNANWGGWGKSCGGNVGQTMTVTCY